MNFDYNPRKLSKKAQKRKKSVSPFHPKKKSGPPFRFRQSPFQEEEDPFGYLTNKNNYASVLDYKDEGWMKMKNKKKKKKNEKKKSPSKENKGPFRGKKKESKKEKKKKPIHVEIGYNYDEDKEENESSKVSNETFQVSNDTPKSTPPIFEKPIIKPSPFVKETQRENIEFIASESDLSSEEDEKFPSSEEEDEYFDIDYHEESDEEEYLNDYIANITCDDSQEEGEDFRMNSLQEFENYNSWLSNFNLGIEDLDKELDSEEDDDEVNEMEEIMFEKLKTNIVSTLKENKKMIQEEETDPTIDYINNTIRNFVMEKGKMSYAFPPMTNYERKTVHKIATKYCIETESNGKSKKRFVTLIKTDETYLPSQSEMNRFLARLSQPYLKPKPRKSPKIKSKPPVPKKSTLKKSSHLKSGSLVGANVKPLDANNIGNKLLRNLGWTGGGLGVAKQGRQDPIPVVIKNNKFGLGY